MGWGFQRPPIVVSSAGLSFSTFSFVSINNYLLRQLAHNTTIPHFAWRENIGYATITSDNIYIDCLLLLDFTRYRIFFSLGHACMVDWAEESVEVGIGKGGDGRLGEETRFSVFF